MLIVGRHLTDEGWSELIASRAGFYAVGNLVDGLLQWPGEHPALFKGIDEVTSELKAVLPYAEGVGRGLRGNPRQIKRFLNILSLRRKLADANQLKVEPDVLIKITILEYVWETFFQAISETVDPETGKSELIGAVLAAADGKGSEESPLITAALKEPGLIDYLSLKPSIVETDLSPYLFLAQTSLSRGRLGAIQPVDEKAHTLALSIESEDGIRARTAAKQAAAADVALSAAVVRILLADLAVARDATVATRIINGLVPICRKHVEYYPNALKAVGQVLFSGDAFAIAASTLIMEGEKSGASVAPEVKQRFLKESPLAAALTGVAKDKRTRRAGG
jgi:hypothetical protein